MKYLNECSMEFFNKIKRHGLKHLIKAEDRDEMRGIIEAERDLEGILVSIEEFDALVAFMETKYVQDAELVLFERLMRTSDPVEEKRIVAQLNHTKKLQRQFMKYVRAKT